MNTPRNIHQAKETVRLAKSEITTKVYTKSMTAVTILMFTVRSVLSLDATATLMSQNKIADGKALRLNALTKSR